MFTPTLQSRRVAIAAALTMGLLSAGCGSTVRTTMAPAAVGEQVSLADDAFVDPSGLSAPGGGVAASGVGARPVAPSTGGAAVPGQRSAASPARPVVAPAPAAGGGGPATGSPGGGGGVAAAPGATPEAPGSAAPAAPAAQVTSDAPLSLGFINTDTGNAGDYGISTGQTYTTQQIYDALVTALNQQGGIGGRLIEPVYATTDTGSSSWANDYQAACATFTQDNHVDAVLGYTFAMLESFEACLNDAGVPHMNAAYEAGDQLMADTHPFLFNSNVTTDRRYRLQLEGAVRAGRVTTASRIGVITGSCPIYTRGWENGAVPYIEQAGLQIAAVDNLGCPGSAQDAGGAAAQIANSVLRFRAEGVDTIHTEGIPVIVFATAAESQAYHPQYVLTSLSGGGALEPNVPASQLQNMYGYGWFPGVDLSMANQPARTPGQVRCLDLLESQGLIMSQFNDFVGAYTSCDPVFLYERALELTGGSTEPAAIASAITGLGTSYAGALAIDGATSFSESKKDGPSQYREFAFDLGCSCFRYTDNAGSF